MIVFAMPRSSHAVWHVLGLCLTAWIIRFFAAEIHAFRHREEPRRI